MKINIFFYLLFIHCCGALENTKQITKITKSKIDIFHLNTKLYKKEYITFHFKTQTRKLLPKIKVSPEHYCNRSLNENVSKKANNQNKTAEL